MSSPFFLVPLWRHSTRAKHIGNSGFGYSLGWSDRHGFRGNKVGSLQPIPVFCPRPNQSSLHVQPLASQQLRVTPGVTRTVTAPVICVFHASVTPSSDFRDR